MMTHRPACPAGPLTWVVSADAEPEPEPEQAPSAAPTPADASIRYWILVLGVDRARLYDADQATISLAAERTRPAACAKPGEPDADPDVLRAEEDRMRFAFLRWIEREVGEIIAADSRPLVVVGQGRGLASFIALSHHRERIVAIVRGEHLHTPPDALVLPVRPLLAAARRRQGMPAPTDGAEGQWAPQHRPRGAERDRSGRRQCDDD